MNNCFGTLKIITAVPINEVRPIWIFVSPLGSDPYYDDVIVDLDTRKSSHYDMILDENITDSYLHPLRQSSSRVPQMYHYVGERRPEFGGSTIRDIFLTI